MSEEKEKKKEDTEVIYVGEKPLWNYLRSVEMLLRSRNLPQVVIKARGRNMSKAIDVAEASKNKFCQDLNLKLEKVEISTENFEKEGKELSVSAIEIILKK